MADTPPATDALPYLSVVFVGHVDHGKSTLIGRLLHDAGALPAGKEAELRAASERRGMPLEWSFMLDGLQAERDQAVTIDTTRVWLKTPAANLLLIDAPGHFQFLKNMVSGASAADAAVLVVDATEGIQEQTKRHCHLLRLLGIRQLVLAINKMDLNAFSFDRFEALRKDSTAYLEHMRLPAPIVVPVSGRHGDNLIKRSGEMPWYSGPTLIQALARLNHRTSSVDESLRLPIQDVYKFDGRRILVGRIESGTLRVNDTLLFSPSDISARVRSIETWNEPPPTSASAGESVGFTLDEPIFVERGDVASHPDHPPALTNSLRATVFWLGHRPLTPGSTYAVRIGPRRASVLVETVEHVTNVGTLAASNGEAIHRGDSGQVTLRSRDLLPLDDHRVLPHTGRFIILDDYEAIGGALVSLEDHADSRSRASANLSRVDHSVSRVGRAQRYGHMGGVLWFTGLSGAGKSTLAMSLERELFTQGYSVYVLDGDNVRRGLNVDLGFSPDDRAENIRRVGEVAALFADAGVLCIVALISPYKAERDRARAATGATFHEIYIKADLQTCEMRDPRGLYRRARAGEITNFTGITAPYEAPTFPDLTVETRKPVRECVTDLLCYVEQHFPLPRGGRPTRN